MSFPEQAVVARLTDRLYQKAGKRKDGTARKRRTGITEKRVGRSCTQIINKMCRISVRIGDG